MNDMSPTITTWIIIGTATVWLTWDTFLFITERETISQKIYKWSKVTMFVPFAFGMLMGHWFW